MPRDAGEPVVYESVPPRRELPAWLLGGAALALLGVLWEAVARLGWVPALFLPAPTAVLAEAGRMARSGELWRHLGASLGRVGMGFALGAVAGTVLGVFLGSSRALWAIGNPRIEALGDPSRLKARLLPKLCPHQCGAADAPLVGQRNVTTV